ncbi:sensor domain-containing diguanylate cyclase [Rhodoferax lacus]|uniref:diguanylate cyclase n=1 Tax=Rhodoferax lacus TaxID=2184758 RepID=A0A3E1RD58_9BURK|nr:diguanylate cyclase [Rhodoferax lacus]RFO97298.1 sensor domain-containing diguanylate cyclase [Rhodoferax lacus]
MRTVSPYQPSIAQWVRTSTALQIATVALGCLLSAEFASRFALSSTGATVLWLPNAVALSALLLTRSSLWWKFGLTQIVCELLIGAGALPLPQALGFAFGNLLEVLLSAYLIRRWCGRNFAFSNLREVLLFAAVAMVLAPGVASLLGTWLHYSAAAEHVSFLEHWQTWWLGDGMGMVVLTPLLFGWLREPTEAPLAPTRSWLECSLFVVLLSGLLYLLLFFVPKPDNAWGFSSMLLLPFFLWAALRFGTLGVSLVGCLVSLLAIVQTYHGRGVFSLLDAHIQAQLLQQCLATLLLTGLAVAAIVNDLGMKYRSLEQAEQKLEVAHAALTVLNQELEVRVAQRTAELERLATTDALTDAHNRRFLMARAGIEIAQAQRQLHAVSLVMFDIDHFKHVNDSHGHNVGDRVLVALSNAVRKELRLGDTFARVGGEEFVMLLPRSDADQALLVAERLRSMVEALEIQADEDLVLHITASFGVATLSPAISTVDALYVAADTALYQAKDSGRNCVVAYKAPSEPALTKLA